MNPDAPYSGSDAPGGPIVPTNIADTDLTMVMGDFVARVTGLAKADIVVGQANRVAQVRGPDFVVMTPSNQTMLSTTTHDYDVDDQNDIGRSTQFSIQVDVYGPNSSRNVTTIMTLFRDQYGCRFMEGSPFQPLYCENAAQMPLIDAEKQYEDRWTIMAFLQGNPSIVTPQQFADIVTATLEEADQ